MLKWKELKVEFYFLFIKPLIPSFTPHFDQSFKGIVLVCLSTCIHFTFHSSAVALKVNQDNKEMRARFQGVLITYPPPPSYNFAL